MDNRGVAAASLISVTAGQQVISAPLALNGPLFVNIATTAPGTGLTISGKISDGQFADTNVDLHDEGLSLGGGGTLTLRGANTYTGDVFIYNGVLNIATGTLGSPNLEPTLYLGAGLASSLGGGTLQFAPGFTGMLSSGRKFVIDGRGTIDTNGNGTPAAPIAFAGRVTISGTFTKAGAGVFELDSTPTLNDGSIAVSGGTLRLNYGSAPANLALSNPSVAAGATLELAGSVSQLDSTVHVSSAGTLLVSSGANQYVGTVIGGAAARPLGNTTINAGASLAAYQVVQSSLVIHGSSYYSGSSDASPRAPVRQQTRAGPTT